MFDAKTDHEPTSNDKMVLAQVGESYWLLEGEAYLNALLANNATYPTPVHCIYFRTDFDLLRMMPPGQSKDALWVIHPDIITRLERHGQLLKVCLPDNL